jgi:hypothetical protein
MIEEVLRWFDRLEKRVEELAGTASSIDTTKAALQKIPAETGCSVVVGLPFGIICYAVGTRFLGFHLTPTECVSGATAAALLRTACMYGGLDGS